MSAKEAGVLPELPRAWDFLPSSSREGLYMGRWLTAVEQGGGWGVLALQWLRAEAFTHLLPSEEATCFGGRIGVCI